MCHGPDVHVESDVDAHYILPEHRLRIAVSAVGHTVVRRQGEGEAAEGEAVRQPVAVCRGGSRIDVRGGLQRGFGETSCVERVVGRSVEVARADP